MFLDMSVYRREAAHYGRGSGIMEDVIQSAFGGVLVSTTVEGRERYSVNVRYPRDYRDNVPVLRDVLVSTPSGADVPLGQVAALEPVEGPPVIKSK